MTDEEKAIDYATTECCHSCTGFCDKNKCKLFCNVRNAVLYGLTEGRKEAYGLYDTEVNDIAKDYEERLKKLEKDNTELKAELQNYADVINRLMGTQLTDTFEIGRLIEIARYRNWEEL